jgi:hypothetical protein
VIATVDYRRPRRVHLEMSEDEFRETVEWLEMVDPHDRATKDWRAELDRLFPPEEDDD